MVKPGIVSPSSVRISVVDSAIMSSVPINMTPRGDAQAPWSRLLLVKLCDSIQFQSSPSLEKVTHDLLASGTLAEPLPPQTMVPVCECWILAFGKGGMEQIQVPSMFSNSTESSPTPLCPLPPVTITTEICELRIPGLIG